MANLIKAVIIFKILCQISWAEDSGYIAIIKLKEINVPDGKLRNGEHCDPLDLFGVNCDIKTMICVEALTDSDTNMDVCRTGYRESSVYQSDTNRVEIREGYYNQWAVPYHFTYTAGSAGYLGIRLKIKILDSNFGFKKDNVIDSYYHDITDPIGTNGHGHLVLHNRGQQVKSTQVKLTYSVFCIYGDCIPPTPSHPPTTARQTPRTTLRTTPKTIPTHWEPQTTSTTHLFTTPPTPHTTVTYAPGCNLKNKYVDIMEITDASANMGSTNYAAVVDFLKHTFVPQFSIGSEANKAQFSSGYYEHSANSWLLYYQQSLSHVQSNLDEWKYNGTYEARLDNGLYDLGVVSTRQGYRTSAKHIALIFGPGINTGSNQRLIENANKLKQKHVTILAIALGSS